MLVIMTITKQAATAVPWHYRRGQEGDGDDGDDDGDGDDDDDDDGGDDNQASSHSDPIEEDKKRTKDRSRSKSPCGSLCCLRNSLIGYHFSELGINDSFGNKASIL